MRRLIMWLALCAAGWAGCGQDNWAPAELRDGHSSQQAKLLAQGRDTYATYCVGCHGEKGDGNGPAAKFLDPKPRDFRTGRLKFAAVPAGSLPNDEDYLRTIDHGLGGTAMPTWSLLPLEERRALVAYVKTFFTGWNNEQKVPAIAIPQDPWERNPAQGIAAGERLYHGFAACYNCHPAYVFKRKIFEYSSSYNMPVAEFREHLYEGETKDSDWGAPIKAPDFIVNRVKFATDRDKLATVIAAGIGGTAMPSWGSGLKPDQLWGLVYYVDSLIQKRGSSDAEALRQALATQPPYTPPQPVPEPAQ